MIDNDIYNNINNTIITQLNNEQCEGCLRGKFIRKSMTGTVDYKVNDIMDMMVCDLIGPFKTKTVGNYVYILQLQDVKSRKLFSVLIRNKSEAANIIID